MQKIPRAEWSSRRERFQARLAPWLEAQESRRQSGIKHPVYDFLFEYYSFRPSRLRQWSPGCGVFLENGSAADGFSHPAWLHSPEGCRLSTSLLQSRCDSVQWILSLLHATSQRDPQLRCFGLHEWAMVYRSPEVRHTQVPLRFPAEKIARIVEDRELACSHFDAFRFFTSAARPRNRTQLQAYDRLRTEQPACIHANMDLYKWATKFHPWIPSDLIADCLLLAIQAREIDMRASPYDLSAYGFEPIPIETPEGREQYTRHQKQIAHNAAPLREKLIRELQKLSHILNPNQQPLPQT